MDYKTFCNIVVCSLLLSSTGVLIDLDHWWAIRAGYDTRNGRWLHFYIKDNWLVLVFCICIWSAVVLAFALRCNLISLEVLW